MLSKNEPDHPLLPSSIHMSNPFCMCGNFDKTSLGVTNPSFQKCGMKEDSHAYRRPCSCPAQFSPQRSGPCRWRQIEWQCLSIRLLPSKYLGFFIYLFIYAFIILFMYSLEIRAFTGVFVVLFWNSELSWNLSYSLSPSVSLVLSFTLSLSPSVCLCVCLSVFPIYLSIYISTLASVILPK